MRNFQSYPSSICKQWHFALRLDHVTVVAALTPKMQKSARRGPNFNFDPPSIQTTPPQVPKWFTGRVGNSLLFGVIAGDVWQSLRRSLVPLMLMYAQSRQIQQQCDRSTVSLCVLQPYYRALKPFPTLWKAARKWGEDTISRQIRSRPLVWKIAFWPLLCMCEFNRRNERETMPIRDLLLQSMITRGCQHLCNDTTVLLCNDNTYHIKTVTGY